MPQIAAVQLARCCLQSVAGGYCSSQGSQGVLVSADTAEAVAIGGSGGHTGLHLKALPGLAHSHALQLLCLELHDFTYHLMLWQAQKRS